MSRKTEADLEAEIQMNLRKLKKARSDIRKAFQHKLDRAYKAMASMTKAELLEHAYQLSVENIRSEFEAHQKEMQGTIDVLKITSELDYTKHKQRKGAINANKATRDFWKPWKARYRELIDSDVKVESARLIVQKEIIAAGGKEYALDGALKRQLK